MTHTIPILKRIPAQYSSLSQITFWSEHAKIIMRQGYAHLKVGEIIIK